MPGTRTWPSTRLPAAPRRRSTRGRSRAGGERDAGQRQQRRGDQDRHAREPERLRQQRPRGQARVVGQADVAERPARGAAGPARRSSHSTAALIIAPSPAPTSSREASNAGVPSPPSAGATPAAMTDGAGEHHRGRAQCDRRAGRRPAGSTTARQRGRADQQPERRPGRPRARAARAGPRRARRNRARRRRGRRGRSGRAMSAGWAPAGFGGRRNGSTSTAASRGRVRSPRRPRSGT